MRKSKDLNRSLFFCLPLFFCFLHILIFPVFYFIKSKIYGDKITDFNTMVQIIVSGISCL